MTLDDLRVRIDEIDSALLELLQQRMEISIQVGKVKSTSGGSVFAPDREQRLLDALEKKVEAPVKREDIQAIYREILARSRRAQKQLVISYLGPEATNCHHAARERFGTVDEFLPARSIPETIAMVEREEADACVIPIENSTEGGVNAAHDALIDTKLTICGEIYIPIHHSLVGIEGIEKVERIVSHPQALAQCRHWLNEHYPAAEQSGVSSTAAAAQLAQKGKGKGTAAIASSFAAEYYHLEVIASNIQDSAYNQTRFLVLSNHMGAPTGLDKTSLLFSVSHEVGALSQILEVFASHKVDLERIESRPAVNRPWEYLFFLDVKGHAEEENVKESLKQVRSKTLWLKILGSYPKIRGEE